MQIADLQERLEMAVEDLRVEKVKFEKEVSCPTIAFGAHVKKLSVLKFGGRTSAVNR